MKKLASALENFNWNGAGEFFLDLLLSYVPHGSHTFISDYIKPFGTIFINLLKTY